MMKVHARRFERGPCKGPGQRGQRVSRNKFGKWKASPYRKKESWIGKERKGGKVWLVVTRDHVW